MIGGLRRIGMVYHVAIGNARRELGRDEHVVEPQVGIRCRQRRSGVVSMLQTIHIDIASIEYCLNGSPPDAAATHPDERSQPQRQARDVERLAWRASVEVSGQDVKSGLVPRDAGEQRAQL